MEITKYPEHLAIIMDGNGRWAKKQGFVPIDIQIEKLEEEWLYGVEIGS